MFVINAIYTIEEMKLYNYKRQLLINNQIITMYMKR